MICDINRHNSPAALPSSDKHQQRLAQSPVASWSILTEKTCELSPTQSILSNRHSSDKSSKHLARNKSLKKVSFEEQPSIIEHSSEPQYREETTEEICLDSCLPPLEEVSVKKGSSPVPVTMAAAAEEQIEIPSEAGGEGEQMIPKKERKPHIKGITFREFDVSHLSCGPKLGRTFIPIITTSLVFPACEGLRGPCEDHRDPVLRGGAREAAGDGGLDSEG